MIYVRRYDICLKVTRKIPPWSNPPGKFPPIKFPLGKLPPGQIPPGKLPPLWIPTWPNSLTLNLIQPLTLTLIQVGIHRRAIYRGRGGIWQGGNSRGGNLTGGIWVGEFTGEESTRGEFSGHHIWIYPVQ